MEETWELTALMGDKDEIEVSAGDKGLTVKAKGGVASRLGHTLADLLSPLSNLTGLVGDEFRNIRVYREIALRKAVEGVHELAIENGVEIKPVPMKYLSNWSEQASLEDISNDENLTDIYSNLLFSVSNGKSPNFLVHLDILRKLDKSHFDFFELLVKGNADGRPSWEYASLSYNIENVAEKFSVLWDDVDPKDFPDFDTNRREASDDVVERIGDLFKGPGVLIPNLGFHFESQSRSIFLQSYANNQYSKQVVDSLIYLGLIQVESLSRENLKGHSNVQYTLEIITLTDFGVEFLKACGK